MFEEVVDAVVIEADGVEHSTGRFHGPGRLVARARNAGNRLGDDSAQLTEVDYALELARVAEGARCHHDRVAELQPAESDAQIHEWVFLPGCQTQLESIATSLPFPVPATHTSGRSADFVRCAGRADTVALPWA